MDIAMTPTTEKPPPKPPRGSPQWIKREWAKLVEDLQNRGIDPHLRVRELKFWIELAGEEFDLNDSYGDANLSQRLAIGRRFSAITNQKLRVLRLLFAPTSGGKE
jgi:hypothetical protein